MRKKKTFQALFIIITVFSILAVTFLTVNYISFWACLIGLEMSITSIEVSSIDPEVVEVDEVILDMHSQIFNPTDYSELKTEQFQLEVRSDSTLIVLRNIITQKDISSNSIIPILSTIQITGVTGEKLHHLKNPSEYGWYVTCVILFEGLLGQTRRTYYLFYTT